MTEFRHRVYRLVTRIPEGKVCSYGDVAAMLGVPRAARGVGAAIIRDLEKQMNEDIPIWENKVYHARPLLCDGDGFEPRVHHRASVGRDTPGPRSRLERTDTASNP